MTNIAWLILALVFFIGTNVLNTLGIDVTNFFYLTISVSTILFILAANSQTYSDRRNELYILSFLIIMLFYRQYNGIIKDSFRSAAILFATPIIFLLIPSKITTKKDFLTTKKILRLLVLFYIVECFLSIYEYIFKAHVFLWIDTTFETHLASIQSGESFRSTSLHGSPLTNALLVTILNVFFTTSILKDKYKFLLWGLGFFAILGFNARVATLVNLLFFALYLLKLLPDKHIGVLTKISIYSIAAVFTGFIYYLMVYKGWGDRLLKDELLDESSAQTRLDLFSVFDYNQLSGFLFGRSMKEFDAIKEAAGLLIIENFWVCEIILFGILFVGIFVILYARLIASYFKGYSLYNKIIICLSFLVLASTNNSLFTQYIPLLLFLICMNLFHPNTLKIILPNKYINEKFLVKKLYKNTSQNIILS